MPRLMKTEDFIEKAKSIHGNEYDYNMVEYINNRTKIKIICAKHGVFEQSPANHTHCKLKQGCPECGKSKTKKVTFLEDAKIVHKNKYDYSKVNYSGCKEKVIIICPTHGEFLQKPDNHKRGSGCPKCVKLFGENSTHWIKDRKEAKFREMMRSRCTSMLNNTLKLFNEKKTTKSYKILGYTPKELKEHIVNHPNWSNVKDEVWNIDHIFPVKAFLDRGIKDISLINCLENLQPLEKYDNLSKGCKYDKKQFEKWLISKGQTFKIDA